MRNDNFLIDNELLNTPIKKIDKKITAGQIQSKTEYRESYCEAIINHCMNGGSVESFSGTAMISPDNFVSWVNKYPDFEAAAKIAIAAEYRYWEEQLQDAFLDPEMQYKLPSINRRLVELGSALMNNGLRKSLYGGIKNNEQMVTDEIDDLDAINAINAKFTRNS